MKKNEDSSLRVVDLFSGAGGLSAGFQEAGFGIHAGIDSWQPACDSFAVNHPDATVHCRNIRKIDVEDVFDEGTAEPDLVLGGPSCQGFSTAGGFGRNGRQEGDERNSLFLEFIRFVDSLAPQWVVMENVPGLLLYRKGTIAKEVIKQFRLIGYYVVPIILLAADYGVPQLRRRLFFIGNRTGAPVPIPIPTNGDPDLWSGFALPFAHLSRVGNKNGSREQQPHVSFLEACGDLPPLLPGETWEGEGYPSNSQAAYQAWAREGSPGLTLHQAFSLGKFDAEAIPHIGVGENWTALPPHLKKGRFGRIRPYDATTLLQRLRPDKPAYTITTKFNEGTTGAFIHPSQDRTLSIREAARLQGFRDSFSFCGSPAEIRKQIGNAVPPLLGFRIAEAIRSRVQGLDQAGADVIEVDPTVDPDELIGLKEKARKNPNQLSLL